MSEWVIGRLARQPAKSQSRRQCKKCGLISLDNGYKAVFAHEFFHLAQWNVLLSTGRPTSYALNVFIEAQGKFAPSVQYPELELGQRHVVGGGSAYGHAANHYLPLHLNSSYRDLEAESVYKYDVALYWRFLYEGFNDMGVIRAALEEMAYHLADQRERDIVGSMGSVMDKAFARVDGPFHTFEESLVAFARANYALRLGNGRCAAADLAECDGYYYDPKGIYVDPPLEAELDYGNVTLAYDGAIPTSFGTDLIKVRLDPVVQDQPLTIKFQGEGAVAQFNVQMWKLVPRGAKPRVVTPQPEIIPQNQGDAHVYVIPHLDTTTYKLALIITRLDPEETADAAGNYVIMLESAGDTGDDSIRA